MNSNILGDTKIKVSPMGLGTLTIGPYQLDMSIEQGAMLISQAVNKGINLLDTARAYKTYPYIREALKNLPEDVKKNIHVISRSYDYTSEGMKNSFNEALKEMNIARISIFMLHEMESALTINGHDDAIKVLVEMKKQGKLSAVGISTHFISAVKAAANHPDIDVIFAILNRSGIGIMDGSREKMESALEEAHKNGKGILVMKALGGGHLFRESKDALEYVRDLPFVNSTIIGMQSIEEINFNISIFENRDAEKIPAPLNNARRLFIEPWCAGCGKCVPSCPFEALEIKQGRACVDASRCMLCSYCARKCPDFCIKVV